MLKKKPGLLIGVLLLVTVLLAACVPVNAEGVPDGLYCIDGTWQLYIGGQIASWYNGLWNDPALGWWLVNNGYVNFGYTGLWNDPNCGWWLIGGGTVAFDYNGIWNDVNVGSWVISGGQPVSPAFTDGLHDDGAGWHLYIGGQVANWFTGLYCDANVGWWLVGSGSVCFDYNGLWNDPNYGCWLVSGGQVNFGYSGLYGDPALGWWLVNGGTVDFGYNGLYGDPNLGWWLVNGGAVNFGYTGLYGDPVFGWWLLDNGQVNFGYTGLYCDTNCGWWLLNGGNVNFGYSGVWNDPNFGPWEIAGGQPVQPAQDTPQPEPQPAALENPMLGVFYNSPEDATDTLFISFDGYTFYSLGEAYTNAVKDDPYNNIATVSPSLNPGSEYSDIVVNTLRDPGIFWKDGAFWMMSGSTNKETGEYSPVLGYSTDLVNWSFPSSGKDYLQNGLKPQVPPLDANKNRTARNDYDGIALDGFADDDGTVWLTVSLGNYTNDANNKMSQYLIKATGLKKAGTSAQMGTESGKLAASIFEVSYSDMIPINIPVDETGADHGGRQYEYDGSLFKDNGKYYLAVQHSGDEVQLWSIGNLNDAATPGAWTLVNSKMTQGSEGPSVTKNGGKYYLYTDRFDGQDYHDQWGNYHGIFVHTGDSLDQEFTDYARVNLVDKNGSTVPARHGSVITLTDPAARQVVLDRFQTLYAQ